VKKYTTRRISEYIRVLSQILYDVIEHNYLLDITPGTLSKTQFTILKILHATGSYNVSELADILRISRAAVSKNVEKLVRTRLVRRKITQSDRRTVEISLTKQGVSLIEDYEKQRLQKQQDALHGFTPQEISKFSDLLAKYVRNSLSLQDNIDLICLQCGGSIRNECNYREHEKKCRYYHKLDLKNVKLKED
jgi:DNA-binding MarR family transcriptional regulator